MPALVRPAGHDEDCVWRLGMLQVDAGPLGILGTVPQTLPMLKLLPSGSRLEIAHGCFLQQTSAPLIIAGYDAACEGSLQVLALAASRHGCAILKHAATSQRLQDKVLALQETVCWSEPA